MDHHQKIGGLTPAQINELTQIPEQQRLELQLLGMLAEAAGAVEFSVRVLSLVLTGLEDRNHEQLTQDMTNGALSRACRRLVKQRRADHPDQEDQWDTILTWLNDVDQVMTRRNHMLHAAWHVDPEAAEEGIYRPVHSRGAVEWYEDAGSLFEVVAELRTIDREFTQWMMRYAVIVTAEAEVHPGPGQSPATETSADEL